MRVRFHHSLHGRLILFGVVPTLLLISALVGFALLEKFRTLRANAEQHMLSAVQLAAANAEDRVNDAVRTARILADVESTGLWMRPAETVRILHQILERDPVVSSVWVVLEPDALPAGEAARLPEAFGADGRFAARVTRDQTRGGKPALQADSQLAKDIAYEQPLRVYRERGVRDDYVGDPVARDGEFVVQITYPIVHDDRVVGVAGAEYSTDEIQAAAHSIAARAKSQLFALSPRGVIIATSADPPVGTAPPDGKSLLRGKNVADTAYAAALLPLLPRESTAEWSIEPDPIDERPTYYVSAITQSGGWRIVLSRPVAEVTAPITRTVVWNLILALTGLVLVGALMLWLAFNVRRRINRAIVAAEAIAGGDLTVRVDADAGTDESGALLRALGVMAARLGTLVTRVKSAGLALDVGVTEIGRSTSRHREAATPLGQSATEVAAAAKQISATGVELSRTMESVQESASAGATIARHGREQLAAVDESMRELDAATASVAGKLATINERAVAISTVVTTITKVADQTNLLSVNAAIEAEKAGEQGRGFLVVAREIRRLADQTAAATLDIAQMVEEMQSAVSAGVMEMDRFADKVRHGVEDVNETSRRMGGIIEGVAENTERFRAVANGMASQSSGALQISDATELLQKSARSAVEGLASLSTAARTLEAASASLRAEVAAFRVADES
ncbi:MAG: methyl-accepting chemotaxis protein [Phycisphaerae bacterium]|nr:methyl-accepting chemotaxis protein [Phycisphaerae bacterium]